MSRSRRNSSLQFLAHNQLHEVLFPFLRDDDLAHYRSIHKVCDQVMLIYAVGQIKDVVGQELGTIVHNSETDYSLSKEESDSPRYLRAFLVKLLIARKYGIRSVLATCRGGVRTMSVKLLNGSPTAVHVAFHALCEAAATSTLVRSLRHVNVSGASGPGVAGFLQSVAQFSVQLESLDISGAASIVSSKLVKQAATNCPRLKSLNVQGTGGRVTDDAMLAVAANCAELQHLNVRSSGGTITDKSMVPLLSNCSQLASVDVRDTEEKITPECLKLAPPHCKLKISPAPRSFFGGLFGSYPFTPSRRHTVFPCHGVNCGWVWDPPFVVTARTLAVDDPQAAPNIPAWVCEAERPIVQRGEAWRLQRAHRALSIQPKVLSKYPNKRRDVKKNNRGILRHGMLC